MRAMLSLAILGATVLSALPAHAYFLDKTRNFDVRFRGYSQVNISAEKTRDENPNISAGEVLNQRNFYNPEFDAKLSDYMSWMKNVPGLSLIAPDGSDGRQCCIGTLSSVRSPIRRRSRPRKW